MWPFAFTTAAIAWACGPMMAMDLSGPAAKARPITSVSQPQITSAAPLTIRSGLLIVIEVLNDGTSRFQLAVDIDQSIDPSLEAGPAEAGSCVEIEREKFRSVLDVERGGLRRDHRQHDLAIPCDFRWCNAAVEQAAQDLSEVLVARRLHELPLRREGADRLDARLGRQYLRRQGRDHEHDVARFIVAGSIERLLDQRGISNLDEIFGAEREVAFPCARL